jgi:hypothetical protein
MATRKTPPDKAQLDAVLAAVAEKPGRTAYQIGLHVPVPQPSPAEQIATGLLAVSAPLSLVVRLLAYLQAAGKLRSEPDPKGARWYLAGCP